MRVTLERVLVDVADAAAEAGGVLGRNRRRLIDRVLEDNDQADARLRGARCRCDRGRRTGERRENDHRAAQSRVLSMSASF